MGSHISVNHGEGQIVSAQTGEEGGVQREVSSEPSAPSSSWDAQKNEVQRTEGACPRTQRQQRTATLWHIFPSTYLVPGPVLGVGTQDTLDSVPVPPQFSFLMVSYTRCPPLSPELGWPESMQDLS